MISLTSTGSASQTSDAYTLLAIIADPKLAQKHLDALTDAKLAAIDANENTRKLAEEAKADHDGAKAKLAEARKLHSEITSDHAVRTKSLDERHAFLVGEAKRLTDYEASVAAREKELGEPLSAREKAVADREATAKENEAALKIRVAEALKVKEVYERKLAKFKEAASD